MGGCKWNFLPLNKDKKSNDNDGMMGTLPIRLEKTPERKELCGKSRIGPVTCFQFPDHG